jgi:hypothetical protein
MKRTIFLLFAGMLSGMQTTLAMPLASPAEPSTLLLRTGAADCKGPIASEAHPIFGTERLAKMRRTGLLPDTFVCGRCTYDLAGDPGVAYYAKTCR